MSSLPSILEESNESSEYPSGSISSSKRKRYNNHWDLTKQEFTDKVNKPL